MNKPPLSVALALAIAFCAGLLAEHVLVIVDRANSVHAQADNNPRTIEMIQVQIKDLQSENARIEHKLDELNQKSR